MNARELIEWGPVRCYDGDPPAPVHEGIVTATTDTRVQVRNADGESLWFDVEQCVAVGAGGGR